MCIYFLLIICNKFSGKIIAGKNLNQNNGAQAIEEEEENDQPSSASFRSPASVNNNNNNNSANRRPASASSNSSTPSLLNSSGSDVEPSPRDKQSATRALTFDEDEIELIE